MELSKHYTPQDIESRWYKHWHQSGYFRSTPDERVYGIAVKTKTLNAEGVDIAAEERSRTDGWEIPAFWGSPVAISNRVYFTTMLGITYVIDAAAPVLDERAVLAINDLGPSGETWSLNNVAPGPRGRLYHRTSQELIAIGGQ